jgi:hypothetical protein
MTEVEMVSHPLVENILTHFEQFVFSELPRMDKGFHRENEKSGLIRRFQDSLHELKRKGNIEEINEIFSFFLKIYLTGDITPVLERHNMQLNESNKLSFMIHKSTQKSLFESESVPSKRQDYSSSTKPSGTLSQDMINNDWLVNRVFLLMNYYSSSYITIFLKQSQEVLLNSSKQQKTLFKFVNKDAPEILLTPLAGKIMSFINKTGESFLNGLANVEKQVFSESLDGKHISPEKSIKVLLKEYFLTENGQHIFPQWFRTLNSSSKISVITDLLKNLP